MSDLARFTSSELLELRTRITSAAIKLYTRGSYLMTDAANLPELLTPDLVDRWQSLRAAAAVATAAGAEQCELLQDIAAEFSRRAAAAVAPLESYDEAAAIAYIEAGHADA